MLHKQFNQLFELAKSMIDDGKAIEFEVRFGTLDKNGAFVAGVGVETFKILNHFLIDSELERDDWVESDTTFFGKHFRRVRSSKDILTGPVFVKKQTIKSIVMQSNLFQNIGFKFSLSEEIEIKSEDKIKEILQSNSITNFRLRNRQQFVIDSKSVQQSMTVDFTLVYQGKNERAVYEAKREGSHPTFEIELELSNNYIKEMRPDHITNSVLLKLKALFAHNIDSDKRIEFFC